MSAREMAERIAGEIVSYNYTARDDEDTEAMIADKLLPLLQLQIAVEKIEKHFISLDGSDDEFWEEVSFGNACEDDNDNKQFYMITKDNKRVIHAGSIPQALINLSEKL